MESSLETNQRSRLQALRDMLTRQRNLMLARIRELRRDQEDETLTVPADELDIARAQVDVEMHASLIERSEDLLKAVDEALTRLEEGSYGICEGCETEIPLERLKALTFALYCVDCQRNGETGRGRGTISDSFLRRWEIPEEMDESLERQDSLAAPEDELIIHTGSAFGAENGELVEQQSFSTRGRNRRRKKA